MALEPEAPVEHLLITLARRFELLIAEWVRRLLDQPSTVSPLSLRLLRLWSVEPLPHFHYAHWLTMYFSLRSLALIYSLLIMFAVYIA